jgi:predicted nucleic acid-binding protein
LIDDAADGDLLRRRIRGQRLAPPALIDLEVLSMFRRAARTRDLEQRRSKQAVTDLAALPLRRVPHLALLVRICELRDSLSVYDPGHVALAEALRAPLLTADPGIADAPAVRCKVELWVEASTTLREAVVVVSTA